MEAVHSSYYWGKHTLFARVQPGTEKGTEKVGLDAPFNLLLICCVINTR